MGKYFGKNIASQEISTAFEEYWDEYKVTTTLQIGNVLVANLK